ncbi:RNA binding motif protein 12Bb [Polypterus senegalus]|nr:RNA binding motif protein 12Bb [Polypterus senegalus]XP_039592408.1 RNA binding motif protein 12Bb [Polypterus senegalus]
MLSMAVVIRLRGLRLEAGSEDIRTFFTGLKIPDGGVHIIGGPLGEAFITFSTDEDARRAMTRSGGSIKGSSVNLLLSSKAEMQNTLQMSRKRMEPSRREVAIEKFRERRSDLSDMTASFAENLVAEVRRMSRTHMSGSAAQHDYLPPSQSHIAKSSVSNPGSSGYLYLYGMPFSATEDDVRKFFGDLYVDEVILFKNAQGRNKGSGIVRFVSESDAYRGLEFDKKYIGSRFVNVKLSSEKYWINAGGSVKLKEGLMVYQRRHHSPAYQRMSRSRSRSPVRYKSNSFSTYNEEKHCILLKKLSHSTDKRDILEFFNSAALSEDQIMYVYDKDGNRTRNAIVMFKRLKDYCNVLEQTNNVLKNRIIDVIPVSKDEVMDMLHYKRKTETFYSRSDKQMERRESEEKYSSLKTCIYVRNLPFDVRKVEVKRLFEGFRISENSVHLLTDDGVGVGEAVVRFRSEEEAAKAELLNRTQFLGTEVLLRRITEKQMKEFGVSDDFRNEEGDYSQESSLTYDNSRAFFPDEKPYPTTEFEVPKENYVSRNQDPPFGYSDDHNGYDSTLDNGGFKNGNKEPELGGTNTTFFDGTTCVKLTNLPSSISINEIYDFCYGYQVIPGSVSLQYTKRGLPKGTATVVFGSRGEAESAVKELSGRPVGTQKIYLHML